MKTEKVKLKDLTPDPENTRRHDERNIEAIKNSLQQFGQYRDFVVQEKGMIIRVGNGMYQAMSELGIKEADAKVMDLTDEEATALSIVDNKTSDLATWNDPVLANVLSELPEDLFQLTGFSEDELNDLINSVNGPENTGQDDPPPPPPNPKSEPGKVYALGVHRLMCGDSTNRDDAKKLLDNHNIDMVFTDPPYGVSYASKNEFLNNQDEGNRIQAEIENDHLSLEETGELWAKSFSVWPEFLGEYCSYYVASPQGGDLFLMMMMMMNENGFPLKHCLIWVKNNHVLGRCDYNYKHEPILYGWKNKHKFYGKGEQNKSTWEYDKPLKNDLHPTMKPIELIKNAILNSTKKEMVVADFFGGSGSTLIACEQTGRRCFTMELDPKYCDVIIQRYCNFKNINPEEVFKTGKAK